MLEGHWQHTHKPKHTCTHKPLRRIQLKDTIASVYWWIIFFFISLSPLHPLIPRSQSYLITTKQFAVTTNFSKLLLKSTLFPHGFGKVILACVWIYTQTETHTQNRSRKSVQLQRPQKENHGDGEFKPLLLVGFLCWASICSLEWSFLPKAISLSPSIIPMLTAPISPALLLQTRCPPETPPHAEWDWLNSSIVTSGVDHQFLILCLLFLTLHSSFQRFRNDFMQCNMEWDLQCYTYNIPPLLQLWTLTLAGICLEH